jgi:hypothetical protein
VRKSGYLSPEDERKLEAAQASEGQAVQTPPAVEPKARQKLEGGIEAVVDSEPYPRVRIRRCGYGPEAVVKEESEALILKALQRGLKRLDEDYAVLMKLPMDAFK